MTVETVATIVTAAVVAGIYSFVQYRRRRIENDEAFDPYQFTATVIVGAIWGGLAAVTGEGIDPSVITLELVGSALVTYGAAVSFTERLFKWLRAEVRGRRRGYNKK